MKPKPRCKNCGDETSFPANADHERSKLGWCVPCYTTWRKLGPGRKYGPGENTDNEWKEPHNIYDKRPFDSRTGEDKED